MSSSYTQSPSTNSSQKSRYWAGLRELSILASPIIATALVQELSGVSTMVFLGRLDNADFIGAATLGNMMCNITGFSLAFGLCSALDTLISQAYGAKLYKLTGLHTQRAILILSLCTIPVYFLWIQTGWILHNVLFINKTVSDLAGHWSKIIAIGLWPSVIFEILRKFLQGQQIIWPVVVASMLATTSNIVCNYLLIDVYHYGFRGPAISVALANWVALISLTVIILLRRWVVRCYRRRGASSEMVVNYEMLEMDQSGHRMTSTGTELSEVAASDRDIAVPETDPEDNWPNLSRNIFLDWGSFLSLGVPGALSLFFEWGSFELVASIAGQLDPVRLATHGVFMSTCGLFYMAPQAIAGATATIAGNYLGENLPVEAKFIIDLGICVDFLWGLVSGLILIFVLRPVWGAMYTDELDVKDMIERSLPIMFLYITVDSTKCITLNILRSIGRPGVTVIGNIISCIFVMLPLGYLLTLKLNLGLTGLWLAMSIAWLVATLVYLYIIVKTDWQQQADVARDRNESASEKVIEPLRCAKIEGKEANCDDDDDDDNDDDDTLVYTFTPLAVESNSDKNEEGVRSEKRWVRPLKLASRSNDDSSGTIC